MEADHIGPDHTGTELMAAPHTTVLHIAEAAT
jgi:hypothetical protein